MKIPLTNILRLKSKNSINNKRHKFSNTHFLIEVIKTRKSLTDTHSHTPASKQMTEDCQNRENYKKGRTNFNNI